MLLAESAIELLFLGALILFSLLAVRIGLHYIDKSIVVSAARTKGWKRVEVKWCPFAPGWFFERGERHYKVDFDDKDGRRKSKYCKIGILTGVYWRD